MGTEPPAQRSLLGLRGRLHGLICQRLVRFDIADDGADQFVQSRCYEVVSGLDRHQKSMPYAACSMGASPSSYRSWSSVTGGGTMFRPRWGRACTSATLLGCTYTSRHYDVSHHYGYSCLYSLCFDFDLLSHLILGTRFLRLLYRIHLEFPSRKPLHVFSIVY